LPAPDFEGLSRTVHQTGVVLQTLEPEFNETFELQEVDMPLQLPLKIEVVLFGFICGCIDLCDKC